MIIFENSLVVFSKCGYVLYFSNFILKECFLVFVKFTEGDNICIVY